MFCRLQGLARSPEELPGESGRAKPSSLQKAQKSASGEGRGPQKYCKTYDICNMDLKNRVHSHFLAPGTKSTAPKHGSVGFFDIPTGLRSAFLSFLQYMDFGAPGTPRELKNRAPGVPGLSKDGILQKVKKSARGRLGDPKSIGKLSIFATWI